MKPTIYILLISQLLLGCSSVDKKKAEMKNSDRTTIDKPVKSNLPQKNVEKSQSQLDLDVNYIGLIDDFYFLDNNEIYIELYFIKDEITNQDWEQAEKLGDSLIFANDENGRTRIPTNKASKYFDLRGIDSISIYNLQNKLIETVRLKRIEYLNQNISPQFIAVFETDQKLASTEEYYCIGNYNKNLDNQYFKPTTNPKLTQTLTTKFDLNNQYVNQDLKGLHFKHVSRDSTISCLNSNESTMIVLTHSSESSVLFESKDDENIHDIIILPIMCKGFPILLTKSFKPESDMFWNNLLVFDGNKYIIKERQKLKIKNSC